MPKKLLETNQELADVAFVKQAKQLLDSSIRASGILGMKKFTPDNLKFARLTLGFQNAFLNAFKHKVYFNRITNLANKTSLVEKVGKLVQKVEKAKK